MNSKFFADIKATFKNAYLVGYLPRKIRRSHSVNFSIASNCTVGGNALNYVQ